MLRILHTYSKERKWTHQYSFLLLFLKWLYNVQIKMLFCSLHPARYFCLENLFNNNNPKVININLLAKGYSTPNLNCCSESWREVQVEIRELWLQTPEGKTGLLTEAQQPKGPHHAACGRFQFFMTGEHTDVIWGYTERSVHTYHRRDGSHLLLAKGNYLMFIEFSDNDFDGFLLPEDCARTELSQYRTAAGTYLGNLRKPPSARN